jgi:hypothetical protein
MTRDTRSQRKEGMNAGGRKECGELARPQACKE